jgi:site-specific recombinase XerD
MILIQLIPFYYSRQECIGLHGPDADSFHSAIKKISGIKWNRIERCWYIPCTRAAYDALKKQIDQVFTIDTSALRDYLEQRKIKVPEPQHSIKAITAMQLIKFPLCKENLLAFEAMRNKLIVKGYSENTIRNYLYEFNVLLRLLKERSVNDLSKDHIQSYLLWLLKEQGCSETKVHTTVNALKFYFEQVMGRGKEFYDLPRPKKPFKLPSILAEEEVLKLIQGVKNLKHKTILMTAYAGGLRVSEIIHLKVKDIDSKRMMIHLHGAKGKKDRMVPLSMILLETLRVYYLAYKPKEFVFESNIGEMYSDRSVQTILQDAKKKAGIDKKGGIHMLRHSYATHLMEEGTDIRVIQTLLGHNSIRTTMLYTHVSNLAIGKIKSPLDKLKW